MSIGLANHISLTSSVDDPTALACATCLSQHAKTCYAAVVELATMATNFGGVSGGNQNVSEVQSLRQRNLVTNPTFR